MAWRVFSELVARIWYASFFGMKGAQVNLAVLIALDDDLVHHGGLIAAIALHDAVVSMLCRPHRMA